LPLCWARLKRWRSVIGYIWASRRTERATNFVAASAAAADVTVGVRLALVKWRRRRRSAWRRRGMASIGP
jgi:hypothetical protein